MHMYDNAYIKESSWLREKLDKYSDLTDKQKCLMIFKLNHSWDNAKVSGQLITGVYYENAMVVGLGGIAVGEKGL